jgi:hypothetical protein
VATAEPPERALVHREEAPASTSGDRRHGCGRFDWGRTAFGVGGGIGCAACRRGSFMGLEGGHEYTTAQRGIPQARAAIVATCEESRTRAGPTKCQTPRSSRLASLFCWLRMRPTAPGPPRAWATAAAAGGERAARSVAN